MNCEKKSEWDYELYPADGSEIGKIPFLKLNVKSGQNIIINYDVGDTEKRTGYIYDARGCGGLYTFSYSVERIGEIEIQIAKDGHIVFSGHNNFLQTYEQDIFVGKYIKIKIE